MGINQELKDKLEKVFKPLGIVAWSGCCRWGCTGSYGGDGQSEEEFKSRDNGIYYIRLHLDGMNYYPDVTSCYTSYCCEDEDKAYEYLMEHWKQEIKYLHWFCETLGLRTDEYEISKPESDKTAIGIHFKRSLGLDPLLEPESKTSDEEDIGSE